MKFFAFAQEKMMCCQRGVVGVITNHSWLDNPTFRGMRESLQRDFDRIYVLDLHGSSKPKEWTPPGQVNGNVFDITKGVCITILIKSPELSPGIFLHDQWGSRLDKYEYVAASTKAGVPWKRVRPFAPFHMFRRLNRRVWQQYQNGWSISDALSPAGEEKQIFLVGSLGFQTHRDDVAISFEKSRAEGLLSDLRDVGNLSSELELKYGLKAGDTWIKRAQKEITVDTHVSKVAYRPFDDRWAEHGSVTMDRPRRELVDNLTAAKTIGLLVPRQIGGGIWRHAAITDLAAESCYVDNDSASQNSEYPLNLSNGAENFSLCFRAFLDSLYDYHYTPQEILGYIYAVLYAPSYRSHYAEFLRIDFPRIPFAETKAQFDGLSDLGWALVQAHLLKAVPKPAVRLGLYRGKGDHVVEAVRYSLEEEAIWINKTQSFAPVQQAVWDFHIGGYQVLDKYLKSRKGRTLTLDEINHIGKVAETLAFTIAQMARIDDAYRAAFPVGDKSTAPLASAG